MLCLRATRTLPAEFLNRVDDIVSFTPLALSRIEQIVDLRFTALLNRLAALGIALPRHRAWEAADRRARIRPRDGARPLRRYISHDVETKARAATAAR